MEGGASVQVVPFPVHVSASPAPPLFSPPKRTSFPSPGSYTIEASLRAAGLSGDHMGKGLGALAGFTPTHRETSTPPTASRIGAALLIDLISPRPCLFAPPRAAS